MTNAASSRRRSREGWPDTEKPSKWAESAHSHELPAWLRRMLVIIGAFMLLVGVGLGCLTYYVYLDHEYVLGRGQYRDDEAVRIQQQTTEQIRSAICDLLDGLPAGPLLDPKRAQYSCGPGVPRDQLPAETQEQLQQLSSGLDVPAVPMLRPRQSPQVTSEAAAPSSAAPSSSAPSQEPTAAVTPAPTTSVPPLVDLGDVADSLCGAVGVCL